ncbi:MAG: hypothetical protein HN846_03765 [Candidatus Pacebacteria bacterium]|jgi:hypothetical protein|nr:hypothetical protein [Candidatus Paceibacterota bacterium]MBT3511882.1 hypothetical protein [Candidatus Paceibacterota bacterium]MBT4005369.1 hypothetical protein [Candidatus Paceibacterota bacterium]MBT4359264.1 hypothetical protein [Candidatus Paceibacterota bacterium]MBT4680901.1 hypothetical protein [Candidatus Paceibacterota bacterium]
MSYQKRKQPNRGLKHADNRKLWAELIVDSFLQDWKRKEAKTTSPSNLKSHARMELRPK